MITARWRSAALAFVGVYILEQACRQQVLALSVDDDGVLEAPFAAQKLVGDLSRQLAMLDFIWPALLRRLDRHMPGYDA